MSEYKSTVGKNLLKILMFNMYHEPKTIYREYVQNALDSINEAVRQEILAKVKDGSISISINRNMRQIVIEDNGKGIISSEAETKLLNIADSYKDGIVSAGQFGIGRLVGAGYCRNLTFETSAKGEAKKTIIDIDVDFVDRIIKDGSDHSSANEVMDCVTKTRFEYEDVDAHYFKVILNDIKSSYDNLLDTDAVIEYLQEVAPIDFGMPFKMRFVNAAPDIYKVHHDNLSTVSISVNQKSDIRKRYGLRVEGTGDNIDSLEYFTISDYQYGDLAWGWFAITKFSTQIPASDKNRGIRLRKHNIQIGDGDSLNNLFTEARGNLYFYGEVHVINDNIEPDSGRSGLAPTPETIKFQNLLKDEFINLKNLYVLANRAKNVIKTVADHKRKSEDPTYSQAERTTSKNNIQTELDKFKKLEDKAQISPDTAKVVDLYKKALENMDSHSDEDVKAEETRTSIIIPEKNTAPPKVKDIFAPLINVLSERETFLVRRVFKSLSDNCPEPNKQLIEELKIMVIKDLSKSNG